MLYWENTIHSPIATQWRATRLAVSICRTSCFSLRADVLFVADLAAFRFSNRFHSNIAEIHHHLSALLGIFFSSTSVLIVNQKEGI